MSDFGNTLRALRGQKSQFTIAQGTGLNIRTIQRLEEGEVISLTTLRTIAKYFRVSPEQYAALLASWVIATLGPDAALLTVEVKGGKPAPVTDAEKFLASFRKIPAKYQKELVRASTRKEILVSIGQLNHLYDALAKQAD